MCKRYNEPNNLEAIMDTNANAQERVLIDRSIKWFEASAPHSDADAVRRSEANILQWTTYLPIDCIRKMIEMGWDLTT